MKWALSLLFIAFSLCAKGTVYIVEIGGIQTDKYFYDYAFYRDEVSKPYVMLREAIEAAGYDVRFTKDCFNLRNVAAIISFSDASREIMRNLVRYPKERCFLFIFEPPVVLPYLYEKKLNYSFGKIFTMFDDLATQPSYEKLYFPMPRLSVIEDVLDFDEKKFCMLINGNKDFQHPKALYEERRKAIAFFTEKGDFDLYGPDWNGYEAWRGPVAAKWDLLKEYKFCICYENMRDQEGYITEKIFDCMVGGCVPVYWGASNIADYVPKEAFIDRRGFGSDEELFAHLKAIGRAEYESYLAAAQNFFSSPEAQRFSSENFVQTVLDEIRRVAP